MRKRSIAVLVFALTAVISGCASEKEIFKKELSIEVPSGNEIIEAISADEIIEEVRGTDVYEKPIISPTSIVKEETLTFDPLELVELNAEYGKEQDDIAAAKRAEKSSSSGSGSGSGSGSSKGGLTDSQKAWLSASIYITEEDVLKYKTFAKGSNAGLDYYWGLFEKASCEMNNYEYDCAKALYDSNPSEYTPKNYNDKYGYYRRTMENGKSVVLVDSFISISEACFYYAENQMIARYGAKYATDYLRLIGVD